jgi:hypothetical protein
VYVIAAVIKPRFRIRLVIQSMAVCKPSSSASRVRACAWHSLVLSLLQACSIGVKSGE